VFGVEPNRIGGTEAFARELSSQLAAHDWTSVLCFEKAPPDDVAGFLNCPNIKIEILKSPTNFNWNATKQLAKILKREKPEILHLHFVGFIGVYPWLAWLSGVKKVFFTDHSSRPSGYEARRAPLWKRMLTRAINYPITKVICVSKFGYRCMETLDLLPMDRFELVYNGVDLSRVDHDAARAAAFRQKYHIPDHKKLVVQISWIIPEKGIPDFLQVAKLVSENRTDVHFVIVGEGPYREEYMKHAAQMGLMRAVSWTGLVRDPFGEGVFDAADIVLQLSRWEELFGWMIAEAMAFGKPVIATKVGGIPELVKEAETGYLVKTGDNNAAAEKVLSLMDASSSTITMGNNAQRSIQKSFDLKQNVLQLISLYGLNYEQ
jgi:glycosyltransferase involved in cell wall biosynthesis